MAKIHPYTIEEHHKLAASLRLAEAGLAGLVAKLDAERLRIRQPIIDRARRLEGYVAGLRFEFQAECHRAPPGLPIAADPYRSA